MSFAINPALNHIDIPEACVYELYRSSAEVLLPDARFHGHSCEAYICIAKIEKTLKAYVALLETEMKTVFVFTSDQSVSEPAKYPEVYAQAEAFVKKLGFVMEPVNLSFSPAMREVIIKGFRVMRPPPQKKQPLRPPKIVPVAEPRKLRDSKPLPPKTPVQPVAASDAATELESLQRELASAKAALAKITRDKIALEQNAAQEIASLKTSCEQAVAANRKATAAFTAEIEKLKLEKIASVERYDDKEMLALKADLQKVHETAATAQDQLHKEIASYQQRMAQLESDHRVLQQQLAATTAAHAEQRDQFAAEKESLLARIASGESATIAATNRIASLERFETAWREGQQREEDLCSDLERLQSELDTLSSELQQSQETSRQNEALLLRVNSLEQELAAAQREFESAASKVVSADNLTAELQQLREEKLAVEAEYVRLANESREKEIDALDAVAAAQKEIERLANELEIQSQVAAMEHEALRAELRKLVVGRSSSGSPALAAKPATTADDVTAGASTTSALEHLPVSTTAAVITAEATISRSEMIAVEQLPETVPLQAGGPAQKGAVHSESPALEEADDEPDRPIAPDKEVVSRLMNEFGGFSGSNGLETTEFSINSALTAVTYRDPEEIAVLLYSINSVQAVPDNSNIQRCKGYVVATKVAGSYNVYVAWYLTESKRVVICTPEQQPVDRDECVTILQDAVAYFEIVGFMMEIAELGESSRSYNRVLKKAPIFCRLAKDNGS